LLDSGRLKSELCDRAEDVRALLSQTTPQARQMLRKLLDGGEFTVTPIRDGDRVGFKFSGRVSLGRLLARTALDPGSSMLVAPTGTTRPNWVVVLDHTFKVAA